jgi:hypothetical protein
MRITPTHGVLHGPEGICPPLPYLVVDDNEGLLLIERGLVNEFIEQGELHLPPEHDTADGAGNHPEVVAETPSVGVAEAGSGGAATAVTSEPVLPANERLHEIAEHIHLLEPDDYVKTGARAGKPKLDVLKAVLGYDITSDEVDQALALAIGDA